MLGVSFESNFAGAPCAADVEAIYGDIQVFLFRSLFPRVELSALINIFTAVSASHAEWCHQADGE